MNIKKKEKRDKKLDETNILELKEENKSDKEKNDNLEEEYNIKNKSDQIVEDITIEYLLSGSFNKRNQSISKPPPLKNKKFYRKRLIQLTKDLLTENEIERTDQPVYHPDIYRSFYQYINTSIDYFQTIDRNDIIQEDYKDLYGEREGEGEGITELFPEFKDDLEYNETLEKANKHMMRQINMKNYTLDGLVKRTVIKKEEPILPKKKKINLKDPELKNKGVGKKNNLTNN
jgi:hypothetical protein